MIMSAYTYNISCYCSWHRLKYFSHSFCSMLIRQLIDLRQLKTENLNFGSLRQLFKTELWMDYFQQPEQIAQKIFESKTETCPVNADLCIAFKHLFSFATDLAASFGFNWFRIMPEIIHKLSSFEHRNWKWLTLAVQYHWNPPQVSDESPQDW